MLAVLRDSFLCALALFWADYACAYSDEPLQERRNIADHVVSWWSPSFPPLVIVDGPAKGRGVADRLVALAADAAPHLRFEQTTISLPRGFRLLNDGQPYCNPSLIPTPERMESAFFTIGLIGPPFTFVVRRDDARLVQQLGPAPSLKAALAHGDLTGAVVAQRSYGAALDPIIAAAGRLYRASSGDASDPALRMVAGGRVDYAIEYPHIVAYDERVSGGVTLFATLPIAETNEPMIGGFACPRTDWGRRIISEMDAIFRAAARTSQFHDIQVAWLPPEVRLAMSGRINAFIERRAAGPWHNLDDDGADLLVAPR